jgi:hypothetical protein
MAGLAARNETGRIDTAPRQGRAHRCQRRSSTARQFCTIVIDRMKKKTINGYFRSAIQMSDSERAAP